jgi:hypothetical protein
MPQPVPSSGFGIVQEPPVVESSQHWGGSLAIKEPRGFIRIERNPGAYAYWV